MCDLFVQSTALKQDIWPSRSALVFAATSCHHNSSNTIDLLIYSLKTMPNYCSLAAS